MKDIGLDIQDVEKIRRVFLKFPAVEKVLLYWSRAKGTYKPASDIDLSLIGDEVNLTIQQEIESELVDLLLPYKFDISIYKKITNPDFKHHIDRVGKILFEPRMKQSLTWIVSIVKYIIKKWLC